MLNVFDHIYKPTGDKVSIVDFDLFTGRMLVSTEHGVKFWVTDKDLEDITEGNAGNKKCFHDWEEYDSYSHRIKKCKTCGEKEYV